MCPVTNEELAAIPFHERVRHIRKDVMDMTQEKFATVFDVDVRTIKGWENPKADRGAPNIENARKLAQLGGYPEVLFFTPQPFEVTLAMEINGKLDLLLAHFGLEAQPAEAAMEALDRLEHEASAEPDDPDVPRSRAGES